MRVPRLAAAVTAVAAAVAGSGACAMNREAALPTVRVRAEKDLACPGDKIHIEQQLGGRYKATGCGHTQTYNSICAGIDCQVSKEGSEAPAWRDRPDPGSFDDPR